MYIYMCVYIYIYTHSHTYTCVCIYIDRKQGSKLVIVPLFLSFELVKIRNINKSLFVTRDLTYIYLYIYTWIWRKRCGKRMFICLFL